MTMEGALMRVDENDSQATPKPDIGQDGECVFDWFMFQIRVVSIYFPIFEFPFRN